MVSDKLVMSASVVKVATRGVFSWTETGGVQTPIRGCISCRSERRGRGVFWARILATGWVVGIPDGRRGTPGSLPCGLVQSAGFRHDMGLHLKRPTPCVKALARSLSWTCAARVLLWQEWVTMVPCPAAGGNRAFCEVVELAGVGREWLVTTVRRRASIAAWAL